MDNQREGYAMSQSQITTYKVFLASPGDVMAEREQVFKVIEDINDIISVKEKPCILDIRVWEHHTYPDIGVPEEVILKQIPIEECDIFVGIFWKRFGTPTGVNRPDDGRPYLSGTEQEIYEAINARKKSQCALPVIMLYRKVDSVGELTDDDALQYAQVINFFRQCQSGGEHPALIKEFKGNEFEQNITKDLLRLVWQWDHKNQLPKTQLEPPILSTPIVLKIPTDPMGKWFQNIGLSKNPFGNSISEDDEDLLRYFVDFTELQQSRGKNLQERPSRWFYFGSAGSGKTALRRMLATKCYPLDREAKVFCVQFGAEQFERALEISGGGDVLQPVHYIQVIEEAVGDEWHELKQVVSPANIFISYAHEDRLTVDSLARKLQAGGFGVWYDRNLSGGAKWMKEIEDQIKQTDYLVVILSKNSIESEWIRDEAVFARNHKVPIVPFQIGRVDLPIWISGYHIVTTIEELMRSCYRDKTLVDTPISRIKAVLSKLQMNGYERLLCLVDQIDQVSFTKGHSDRMVQLLSHWMILPDVKGFESRYFLPSYIHEYIEKDPVLFQLSRCKTVHIQWTEVDLRELIQARLAFFANKPSAYYVSIGQFCENKGGFAESIDAELVRIAEGNPRAVVWLANRLIELHCRVPDPPFWIRSKTWEGVKQDWDAWGRRQILGFQREGFYIVDKSVFFSGNLVVLSSPRRSELLWYLVFRKNMICTPDELLRAGWPDDDPRGVTPHAMDETIRRIKQELHKQGIEPDLIETIRGQGYRLKSS